MLAAAIRAALVAGADPDRAAQQQAYMKSALPYRGLSSPQLRTALRPLLAEHRFTDREDWESCVHGLWDGATHREEWYAAIALLRDPAYRAWVDPRLLPLLEHLLRTGAWWDVVDEISAHLVGQVLLDSRPEVTGVIDDWSVDGHLWVRRSAMLAQLRHKERTDTDLLERVLDGNLDDTTYGREFFIRKALGWALREHARTDPAWVRDYLRTRAGRLSGLSVREASKHLARQTGTSSTAPTA